MPAYLEEPRLYFPWRFLQFDIIHYDYTHMFGVEIKTQTHIHFMEKAIFLTEFYITFITIYFNFLL